MQTEIKEYNEMEIAERQDLPNLFEAIKMAKEGNLNIIDRFFYGQKMIERFPYDGKMTAYEVKKVHFWDKPTDIFLGHLKKRYTRDVSISAKDKFEGREVSYSFKTDNFEESEIDELFYRYILELINKINLDKFVKETESKTLNAIRKYIRVDFENNFLKKEANNRIGLERVQVDGKMYWVKQKKEEVFFDDIYIGMNDDGEEFHFLDIVGTRDTSGIDATDFVFTSKKFIEENMEDALTKSQYEKWEMLVEHVEEHGIDSILDKHTGKVKKTAIAKIFYPNKSERSTTVINKLIQRMNDRIEKKLIDAGMKFVSSEEEQLKEAKITAHKSGKVEVYQGGLSEEEVEKYFQSHLETILKSYTEGRLVFDKGTNTMLPSIDTLNELPFEVYEQFKSGTKKERLAIIEAYHNQDKFKLRAGNKEVTNVVPAKDYEEKNDKYISPEQLKEIQRESKFNKSNK